MKKFGLFLFIISAIVMSCSSDDSNTQQGGGEVTDPSPLIGTWELTAKKQDGSESELSDCDKTSTLQFNPNNTLITQVFSDQGNDCIISGEFTGSWSVSGNNLTFSFDEAGPGIPSIVTFIVFNNILTITYSETEETYKKK